MAILKAYRNRAGYTRVSDNDPLFRSAMGGSRILRAGFDVELS